MLPPNPLLQLTPLRVARALARVKERIWIDFTPVAVEATAPGPDAVPLAAARRQPRRRVRPGEAWGRLHDQRWCRVVLPAARGLEPRWLNWEEEGEATLHVNGFPYFGFDVGHRHCVLPRGAREVWVECHAVQAGIWHPDARGLSPQGNVFRGAAVGRRDESAWAAYHDLLCLAELMIEERATAHPEVGHLLQAMQVQPTPARVPVFYRRLLRGLDEAIDALDRAGPEALRRRLAPLYRELRTEKPLMRAALTGHSHLDLVWLWPESTGEAKAVHLFANVHHLFAHYPEFRFAYSQPASYEAVARRAPALHAAVQRDVRAGRWEPTGVLYVESDSHIACGEGLVRSLQLGQAGFRRLRGKPARALWLPDLFGFSACLPQLMRLGGADSFFTTKLQWNALHRFPHTSFVWRGPGGAEILAHTPQETGFNNELKPAELIANARGHAQSDVHPEVLFPCGWGDGGGGPSAEHCERARRLGGLGEVPSLRWDQPENFFDRLAAVRDRLPAFNGEILLEAHRGTYTTRREVKQTFRSLERALQVREAAAVARGDLPDLGHAWRRLVFAQFHDYIPGSSIPEVYQTGLPELQDLAARLQSDAASSLVAGRRGAGERCVFNPLPFTRRAWVGGELVELPPLAGVPLSAAAVRESVAAVTAAGRRIDNGVVSATLDARGHLSRLVINGQPVALRRGAGALVLYPDHPSEHQSWEIERHTLSLGEVVNTPCTIRAEHDALVVGRRVGKNSYATVRYWLAPGAAALRVTIEVDWQEPEALLRLQLPTDYRGRDARYGTAFGSVHRPQLASTPQVEALWELPASRYATVANDDGSEGVAIITESNYGFSCRDGVLAVSLLRSPLHVGADKFAVAYPRGLARTPPDSVYTDLGQHTLHLAIAADRPDAPARLQPAALAESLFTPVVVYRGAPSATAFGGLEDAPTLLPSWAQPEGSKRWVLRLHETRGRSGTAKLRLTPGWKARKVNLLGEPIAPALRGSRLPYAPYEIISLLLEG